MAGIIKGSFDYTADAAIDCNLFVPGQGGTELSIGNDGVATVSSGFDLDFLPRARGPVTSAEADTLNSLGTSWTVTSPMVPAPLPQGASSVSSPLFPHKPLQRLRWHCGI